MDIMKKITICSFCKNKKRTIVTIVGIMLATALITAVACMGESLRFSLIDYEKKAGGDYHDRLEGVKGEYSKYFSNNANFETVGFCTDLGYAVLSDSQNEDKPYIFVKEMSENGPQCLALALKEGRMPKTGEEIVISEHMISNGGSAFRIGDEVTLQIGNRMIENDTLDQGNPLIQNEKLKPRFERTFRIVGIIRRPDYGIEPYGAPGYTAYTCGSDFSSCKKVDVYVRYKADAIDNRNQILGKIFGLSKEEILRIKEMPYYRENELCDVQVDAIFSKNRLIMLETLDFSESILAVLYTLISFAIVIIIVTSIFCIRNSFMISMTEKMRLYAMITSIGATKKQRRKMVFLEARYLCLIGIPLGVLTGILATYITVNGISKMLQGAMEIELVVGFSYWAIVIAILVSIITVFLSAMKSARTASRFSPIEAIRGSGANEAIFGKKKGKNQQKSLRAPKIVTSLFGIGGKLAYKNLKRSKVKYRTTVISIVISVSVFIGLTTFTEEIEFLTKTYYKETEYPIHVDLDYASLEKNEELAAGIGEMEGIDYLESARTIFSTRVKIEDLPTTEEWKKEYADQCWGGLTEVEVPIIAIGEGAYERYCKAVGVSVEEVKNSGILINNHIEYSVINGKQTSILVEMYTLEAGNQLPMVLYHENNDLDSENNESISTNTELTLNLAAVTTICPERVKDYSGNGYLVVSDEWFDQYREFADQYISVRIHCKNPDQIEQNIEKYLKGQTVRNYSIYNIKKENDQVRSLYVAMEILLYGFITVIALIGITNIVNTVVTNMELRSREFAMMKSIGMTQKEFRKMILLENIFYGGKAMLFAIPLGLLISYQFYRILKDTYETTYHIPIRGIGISLVAVGILLWGIMEYTIAINKKRNMIETITNENI